MTLSRDTLIEAVVIGGTAGLFAAGTNIAARYASDPGDVLGFIGGAVGAGAAVVGALWLERRKASDAARERVDALGSILAGIASRAGKVLEAGDAERRLVRIGTLRQTIGTFQAMRASHVLSDPENQTVLDTFAEGAEYHRVALERAEQGIIAGTLTTEEAVAGMRAHLVGMIEAVAAIFGVDLDWPVASKEEVAALKARFGEVDNRGSTTVRRDT